MFLILAFVVIALVAGFIANYLVAGRRKYENWELFVIGIVGSFVGGLDLLLLAGDGSSCARPGSSGRSSAPSWRSWIYGPIRDQLRKRNIG
ncbi:MAG: hypothetical protein R3C32_04015 [Chloroflexota bacterium]